MYAIILEAFHPKPKGQPMRLNTKMKITMAIGSKNTSEFVINGKAQELDDRKEQRKNMTSEERGQLI